MSEHKIGDFLHEHKKGEVVAGIVTIGSAAILGTHAIRSRHRREGQTLPNLKNTDKYKARLEVFRNDKIKPTVRDLLPQVAGRVYLATHDSASDVILFGALLEQTGLNKDKLAKALGFLGDAGVVAKRKSTIDPSHQGYYAAEPLMWAATVAGEEVLPELHDAISDILNIALGEGY